MPVLLTCEHAVNTIPAKFQHLFIGAEATLSSHRGIDIGALSVATALAEALQAPLFSGEVSRLLIELNRSIGHHHLFSEFTNVLSNSEKDELIQSIYIPFRSQVEQWIRESAKPVVHLSIHSFTPVFNQVTRAVDIGLLFDPESKFESHCCSRIQLQLKHDLPGMNIQFNEPYQGIDDGFTTYLRTRFDEGTYAGIEIELNQKYAATNEIVLIQSALISAVKLLD